MGPNTASIPILFSDPNTDRKYSVFWSFLTRDGEGAMALIGGAASTEDREDCKGHHPRPN